MNDIAKSHHARDAWRDLVRQIRSEIRQRQVHPAGAVVLLPFAQLMQQARLAWAEQAGGAQFVPRFETSMNWSRSLGGFSPAGDDLRRDCARDLLTAADLLSRAGMSGQKQALAPLLMRAAWSVAGLAAAVPASERLAWGARMGAELVDGMDAPALAWEVAIGRIAIAWAASSRYASDLLSGAEPSLLFLLDGFSAEPMAQALRLRLGDRALSLALNQPAGHGECSLHRARDAESEAQQAAACVLNHLAQGRSPVGLVAQDRVLTRRISALLAQRQLALRDETGWKLSTTRAAAALMSLVRALTRDAGTDAVLDWLKNAPAFDVGAVDAAEREWRRAGVRQWRSVPQEHPLALRVRPLLQALQQGRPLAAWLRDLRAGLQAGGQWPGLAADLAGQAVLDALRLREGAEAEFDDLGTRLALNDFTAWVSQTLEAASFHPEHPAQGQVVILPLSQLLGRPLAAVVLAGCDERRLPVSPEPAELWSPAQRALLGLPSRAQLAAASRSAWDYALQSPWIDILWRSSEDGEPLLASGFVQELLLQGKAMCGQDPRCVRRLPSRPVLRPEPSGAALAVTRLSASGYEDLRRCPYRFFALRQLGLQEAEELDTALDKRDFGNWLHRVFHLFHQALHLAPSTNAATRRAMIDTAARQASVDLGLAQSEFLPFVAAWPRVRSGYLEWLAGHEAGGAVFEAGEQWREMPLGALTLVGKLDRVDRLADGSVQVLDYKTEARSNTAQRIGRAAEDTQLPFYAALVADDTVAAAYVSVGEKDGTRAYPQAQIVELRDRLIEGILHDMERIGSGAELPALGQGSACEFCAARGLCRKDFWASGAAPAPPDTVQR